MNLLSEKNIGYRHEILWKIMFCAKKVTKLPDLTVVKQCSLTTGTYTVKNVNDFLIPGRDVTNQTLLAGNN
jgi:hypothetical protein